MSGADTTTHLMVCDVPSFLYLSLTVTHGAGRMVIFSSHVRDQLSPKFVQLGGLEAPFSSSPAFLKLAESWPLSSVAEMGGPQAAGLCDVFTDDT